jgi:Zn-dependent protease
MLDSFLQFAVFALALLITLTVHEASHAMVAYYLGDPTAKIRGRLTLNPIKHLDPIGTILFIITQRIGWGKPVPVDPRNFKHPVRDSAFTALAGPMSNFIFAFFLAILWRYTGTYMHEYLLLFVQMLFHVNIYLGVFNLFPFPPLDGSKILGLFIPKKYHVQYLNFLEKGMRYFVAIILLDVFILRDLFGFSVFGSVMGKLHDWIAMFLLLGT